MKRRHFFLVALPVSRCAIALNGEMLLYSFFLLAVKEKTAPSDNKRKISF